MEHGDKKLRDDIIAITIEMENRMIAELANRTSMDKEVIDRINEVFPQLREARKIFERRTLNG